MSRLGKSSFQIRHERGQLPQHLERVYWLIEIAGLEAALTLLHEWGGTQVYIPKLDSLTRTFRDDVMREAYILD